MSTVTPPPQTGTNPPGTTTRPAPLIDRTHVFQPHNPAMVDIIGNAAMRNSNEAILTVPGIEGKISPAEALRLAKTDGNVPAARAYVRYLFENNPNIAQQLLERHGASNPIIVPVAAIEGNGTGRYNPLPDVFAHELRRLTGWQIQGSNGQEPIVQSTRAGRTGAETIDRFVRQAGFSGPVVRDQNYIVIDDHFSNGGTLRNLTDFIERQGGRVIAASTLTNGTRDNSFAPSRASINRARQNVGANNFEALHQRIFGVSSENGVLFTSGELRIFGTYEKLVQEEFLAREGRPLNGRNSQLATYQRLTADLDAAVTRHTERLAGVGAATTAPRGLGQPTQTGSPDEGVARGRGQEGRPEGQGGPQPQPLTAPDAPAAQPATPDITPESLRAAIARSAANPETPVRITIPGRGGVASAELTVENGKLATTDPRQLRATLESNPDALRIMRTQEIKNLLDGRTAGLVGGIRIRAPQEPGAAPPPRVVTPAVDPALTRPLLHSLDPVFNQGAVRPQGTSNYERGKPITAVPINGVLTVGPIEDFQVSDNTARNERSTAFARDLSAMLNISPERMAAYVPPRVLTAGNQAADVSRFVNDVLISRVTTAGEGGVRTRLPVEEAARNMRFTIATHSYGGNFIDEAGAVFQQELTRLGYSEAEVSRISRQVAVVNMGGTPTTNDNLEIMRSPFNEIRLVGRTDRGVHEMWGFSDPEHIHRQNVVGVELPTEVTAAHRGNRVYTGEHGRMTYLQGINNIPEVSDAVRRAVDAPRLDANTPLVDSIHAGNGVTRTAPVQPEVRPGAPARTPTPPAGRSPPPLPRTTPPPLPGAAPAAPPVYQAAITGNEFTVRIGGLFPAIVERTTYAERINTYRFSSNDPSITAIASPILTPAEEVQIFNERRARFEILRASDLNPANERALLSEYGTHIRERFTPENIRAEVLAHHTNSMTVLHGADIAREMHRLHPNNAEFAALVQPDLQRALSFDASIESPTYQRLLNAMKALPQNQGPNGAQNLNNQLRGILETNGLTGEANRAQRSAVEAVLADMGVPPDQRVQVRQEVFGIPPAEQIDFSRPLPVATRQDMTIDTARLERLAQRQIPVLEQKFRADVTDGREALVERARHYRAADPFAPGLTDIQARNAFEAMLNRVPPNGTARQLVDIALNNPDLRIVMIEGRDVSNHYGPHQHSAIAGFSRGDRNEIYLSTQSGDPAPLLIEEAMHNAIRNIYNNQNSTPWTEPATPGAARDPRQALLQEAFRADLERMGRNQEQMRRDLSLPEGYAGREFYAEAVVKLEWMEATGRLTPELAERYRELNRFRTEIIHTDATAHQNNQPLRTLTEADVGNYRARGGIHALALEQARPRMLDRAGVRSVQIPVEMLGDGPMGARAVEVALERMGIPRQEVAPDGTVTREGYRIVQNEELRAQMASSGDPNARGTTIEIPETLLQNNNAELHRQLTGRANNATATDLAQVLPGRDFRTQQAYNQLGLTELRPITDMQMASVRATTAQAYNATQLLDGLGLNTNQFRTAIDGNGIVEIPRTRANADRIRQIVEAHKALSDQGVRGLPEIRLDGDSLRIVVHQQGATRAAQLSALLDMAPNYLDVANQGRNARIDPAALEALRTLNSAENRYNRQTAFFNDVEAALRSPAGLPADALTRLSSTAAQTEATRQRTLATSGSLAEQRAELGRRRTAIQQQADQLRQLAGQAGENGAAMTEQANLLAREAQRLGALADATGTSRSAENQVRTEVEKLAQQNEAFANEMRLEQRFMEQALQVQNAQREAAGLTDLSARPIDDIRAELQRRAAVEGTPAAEATRLTDLARQPEADLRRNLSEQAQQQTELAQSREAALRSLRQDARNQHGTGLTNALNEQQTRQAAELEGHQRQARNSAALNLIGLTHGINALVNPHHADPNASTWERSFRSIEPYTQIGLSTTGLTADIALRNTPNPFASNASNMTRAAGHLTHATGTAMMGVGAVSSWFDLERATSPQNDQNTNQVGLFYVPGAGTLNVSERNLQITEASIGLGINTVGTVGSGMAWLAPTGSGLSAAGAATMTVVMPVLVVYAGYQTARSGARMIEAYGDQGLERDRIYDNLRAQVSTNAYQGLTREHYVDIPGMRPDPSEYGHLNAYNADIARRPATEGPRQYTGGELVPFEQLMRDNPTEYRRLVASSSNSYREWGVRIQREQFSGLFTDEALTSTIIGGYISAPLANLALGAMGRETVEERTERGRANMNAANGLGAMGTRTLAELDGSNLANGRRGYIARFNDYARMIQPLERDFAPQVAEFNMLRPMHRGMNVQNMAATRLEEQGMPAYPNPSTPEGARLTPPQSLLEMPQGPERERLARRDFPQWAAAEYSPIRRQFNAATVVANREDATRIERANTLAANYASATEAQKPAVLEQIREFMNVSPAQWTRQDAALGARTPPAEGNNSLQDVVRQRASEPTPPNGGLSPLRTLLVQHVMSNSAHRSVAADFSARLAAQRERAVVEPLLARDRGVDEQRVATVLAAQEVTRRAEALRNAPEGAARTAAQTALTTARENALTQFDTLQTRMSAGTRQNAAALAEQAEIRAEFVRRLDADQQATSQGRTQNTAAMYAHEHATTRYQSAAQQHFDRNAEFIRRAGIGGRSDIRMIGLSTSQQQYVARLMAFAPETMVEAARAESVQYRAQLAPVTQRNTELAAAMPTVSAVASRMGVTIPPTPWLDSRGVPMRDRDDRGQPTGPALTLEDRANRIRVLLNGPAAASAPAASAPAISGATASGPAVSTPAPSGPAASAPAPSGPAANQGLIGEQNALRARLSGPNAETEPAVIADINARVVLNQAIIDKMTLELAQVEQENMVGRITRLEEIQREYSQETTRMFDSSIAATNGGRMPVNEAGAREIRQLEETARQRQSELDRLRNPAPGTPRPTPNQFLIAQGNALAATRALGERMYAATRVNGANGTHESLQADQTALDGLRTAQREQLGMTPTPATPRSEIYNQAILNSQVANQEFSRNPTTANRTSAFNAYAAMAREQGAHMEVQFATIRRDNTRAENNMQTLADTVRTMETQNTAANITVETSEATRTAAAALATFRRENPTMRPPAAAASLRDRISFETKRMQLMRLEWNHLNARRDDINRSRGDVTFPTLSQAALTAIDNSMTINVPAALAGNRSPFTGENRPLGTAITQGPQAGSYTLTMENLTEAWNNALTRRTELETRMRDGVASSALSGAPREPAHFVPPTAAEITRLRETAAALTTANQAFSANQTPQTQRSWIEATARYTQALDQVTQAREQRRTLALTGTQAREFTQQIATWKRELGDLSGKSPEEISELLATRMRNQRAASDRGEEAPNYLLENIALDAGRLGGHSAVPAAYQEFLESIGGPQVLRSALLRVDPEMEPGRFSPLTPGLEEAANTQDRDGRDSRSRAHAGAEIRRDTPVTLAQAIDNLRSYEGRPLVADRDGGLPNIAAVAGAIPAADIPEGRVRRSLVVLQEGEGAARRSIVVVGSMQNGQFVVNQVYRPNAAGNALEADTTSSIKPNARLPMTSGVVLMPPAPAVAQPSGAPRTQPSAAPETQPDDQPVSQSGSLPPAPGGAAVMAASLSARANTATSEADIMALLAEGGMDPEVAALLAAEIGTLQGRLSDINNTRSQTATDAPLPATLAAQGVTGPAASEAPLTPPSSDMLAALTQFQSGYQGATPAADPANPVRSSVPTRGPSSGNAIT